MYLDTYLSMYKICRFLDTYTYLKTLSIMMAKKWNITLLYVHIKMTHHPSSQILMRILELPTILEMLCYHAGQLRCDIFFRGTFDQSFIISYRSIEPIYKWLIEDTNCAHKKWSNSNLFENTFFLKIFVCLTFPWSINQNCGCIFIKLSWKIF